MTLRVLVAEPDDVRRRCLTRAMTRYGFSVIDVRTAEEALSHRGEIDVALIDLNLPDADGVKLCETFRSRPEVVILAFTAKESEVEHVLALQAGADHCLARDVGVREIIARIEAVQRRIEELAHSVTARATTADHPPLATTINGETLHIDPSSRRATLRAAELSLTRKEFDLLTLLVGEAGRGVPRGLIMEKVWLDDSGISTRTLDTHVHSLRRKLRCTEAISCVRQFGYRFQAT